MKAARIGIAIAGGIAFIVVLRAAAYYQKSDPLALGLVLAMAVTLAAGLVEVWRRAARASRLEAELATLPAPATTSAIDGASAELRALLRARMAHAPIAAAPSIAPFLVGLLVMLGLLGTFLGLFETLRGAREALTTSGDVDALRAGLAMPMAGLTRSFGTSAAGVSASAMLGLASAFARATEASFFRALAAYASGPLAPLTTQARQLAALEQLAAQAEAMPRAAAALEAAVAQLASLEKVWNAAQSETSARVEKAHAQAAERAEKAHAQAAERVAEMYGASVERAEKAQAQAAERAEKAHAEAAERAEKAHAETAERAEKAHAETAERAEKAHAETAAQWTAAYGDAAEKAARALREAVAEVRGDLKRAIDGSAIAAKETLAPLVERAVEGSVAAAKGHVAELRAHLDADIDTRRKADASYAKLLHEAATRMTASAAAGEQTSIALREAVVEVRGDLRSVVVRSGDAAREALAPLVERAVEGSVAAAKSHVAELRARLDADIDARRKDDAAHAKVLGEAAARLTESAAAGEKTAIALRDAVAEVRADLRSAVERSGTAARDAIAPLVERAVAGSVGAAKDHVAELRARLDADVDARRKADAAHAKVLTDAAARLAASAASGEDTSRALSAAISAIRAELTSAIARSGDAAREALAPLVERAVEGSVAAAKDHVAELRARLDADVDARRSADVSHAKLLDEVTARLTTSAASAIASAGARLDAAAKDDEAKRARIDALIASIDARNVAVSSHAEAIGARMNETASVVHEAATLLQSGGFELTAVAEMFASAVDRQREAAAQWLESLGAVEAAVQRAGETAAASALGEQLDRARELFDGQLEFHRELLVQLRGRPPVAHDRREGDAA